MGKAIFTGLYKRRRPNGFIKFEIIIDVLVISIIFFNSFSAGTVFRRNKSEVHRRLILKGLKEK